jgi:hypothetical protein
MVVMRRHSSFWVSSPIRMNDGIKMDAMQYHFAHSRLIRLTSFAGERSNIELGLSTGSSGV